MHRSVLVCYYLVITFCRRQELTSNQRALFCNFFFFLHNKVLWVQTMTGDLVWFSFCCSEMRRSLIVPQCSILWLGPTGLALAFWRSQGEHEGIYSLSSASVLAARVPVWGPVQHQSPCPGTKHPPAEGHYRVITAPRGSWRKAQPKAPGKAKGSGVPAVALWPNLPWCRKGFRFTLQFQR